MKKITTWLLIANTNSAFIYDFSNHEYLKKLSDHLLKSFEFPEGKLRSCDLATAEPGRDRAKGAPSSSFSPDTSPHDVELERFSHLIAEYLLAEKLAHSYERLIVCAEPRFLGILEKHFSKQLKESISRTINKDYIPLINNSFNEFIERIKDNLL